MRVQQADEVTSLLSPGRQQRLGVQVQRLVGDLALAARPASLAQPLGAQQVLVGHHVRPVVLTGVVHAHQHLHPARQGRQHLQRLLRERRDAEHNQPTRQACRPIAVPTVGLVEKAPVHIGDILCENIADTGSNLVAAADLDAE